MRHALIIGAGIAGPVTAMALQRAGISATIYEAYAESAEGAGGFLTLAVNGQNGLRTLDLSHCLRDGFKTPRMAMYSGTGKRLVEFDNGPTLPGDVVSRTISRGDLYRALRAEALARGVKIVHDKRLVGTQTGAGKVRAIFADTTTAEGDLLVGTDGLRSRTRTLIDPNAPEAAYTGLLNTGGYARGVRVDAEPGEYRLVYGYKGFFGYVVHPDDGTIWWFANLGEAAEPSRDELAAIDVRARLNEMFAKDKTPALDIIAHTPHIITPYGTYDFKTVPTWHRDNMIIIGDAAHAASPSAGQGASMAIEDAVVVARSLLEEPTTESAFAHYENQRRARVERVVEWGRKKSAGKAPGPLGRMLRDHAIFPLFVGRNAGKGADDPNAWLYEFPTEWDAITARR